MLVAAGVVACGSSGGATTAVRASVATPASVAAASAPDGSPLAAADAAVAGLPVVGRGCVRPDQVPGEHPAGTTVVCVYERAYNAGEVHVALAPGPGDPPWRVLAVEQ